MTTSWYKKYLIGAILLFLVAVHFIAYNIKAKGELNLLERSVLFIAFPMQKLISLSTERIVSVWKGYVYLVGLARENTELKERIRSLEADLGQFRETEAENRRLKDMLDFTDSLKGEYVAARVMSTGPSNFYHTLILNRGSEKGIERGFPVVTKSGVVGQISYVSGGYSAVITLVDPNSAIDAVTQDARARGILQGSRYRKLIFKYLPFSEKVSLGDRVVSSGMDGIYPKGIAVGEVVAVENRAESLFQEVTVTPSVDFSKLEEVLVLLKKADEEKDKK